MRALSLVPVGRKIVVAVATAALMASPAAVGIAAAHDVVLHSTPADGATVDHFPKKIVLEFSAIPKDSFNTVAVSNADDGTVLFTATPTRDKQFMSVAVPEDIHPGDGHYVVGFQITSSDGHATRGKTTFTVGAAGQSSPSQDNPTPHTNAPASSPVTESTATGPSVGLIVALMALVAVCAGVVIMMKKRK